MSSTGTQHQFAPPVSSRNRPLLAILVGGLIAGVLDISYALIFYGLRGTKPMTLFQSIASGLLGRSAYKGGMQAATLGAILHFVIALGAAAVYYAASRKVAILTSRPVMSGMAFGAGVWLVMNLLVLPLSQFGPVRFQLDSVLWGLAAHMVLIGVPIALSVQRFARG